MPLAMVGRPKDAVIVVPRASQWQAGVARFLAGLGADGDRVARHLALLEDRAAGRLPWAEILADRFLPNGRPMPASRAYAEMLVTEDVLPLYDTGAFPVTIDLHNPQNEAGSPAFDPELLELAIVADVGAFGDIGPDSRFDQAAGLEAVLAQRASHGEILGDLVTAFVEATDADFAYADVGATGWRVDAATSATSVVHTAPAGTGPWDYLWSITAWGPRRLSPDLRDRLDRLTLGDDILAKVDRFIRPHVRLDRRTLATGARFLQYRFLFGSEGRSDRADLDTPLAGALGLRSTNLLFRG